MNDRCSIRFNKHSIKKRNNGKAKTIKGFQIEITNIDFIVDPWNEGKPQRYSAVFNNDTHSWEQCPHTQYTVKLTRNNQSAEFTFTDSIHSFINKSPADLKSMLACFLDEAASFINLQAIDDWEGAQNIMDEFGYTDMKKARDIYRGLFENYLKIKPLVDSENELYKILEKFQEEGVL